MPYYALAAARSGDPTGLQKALDALPAKEQDYEVILARAVFAGLAGRPDEALATLERAFHCWAYCQESHFPMSAYQYLATCTLIFEATENDAYRQAALRLARPLRRLEPAFAFSHALVAFLSDDPAERTEALAAALYLDPGSRWATEVPAPVMQAARDLLRREGNPFSLAPRARGGLTAKGQTPNPARTAASTP
jgi:tetratricopeptide (TPR) repeat protein